VLVLIDALIIGLLAVWLVATVARQVARGRLSDWLTRMDPAALVPAWTFFAPRPGVTDYAIVYRDLTADGEPTAWRGLIEGRSRRSLRWLWHPDKRVEKLVTDLVPGLARGYEPEGLDHLLDTPYLTLLAAVENAEHDARAHSTQFAVLAVTSFHSRAEAGPVFVSAPVTLSRAAA
jgi:hypothetical protein